ncbi:MULTISPECIES: TRAP transporter substrate-binding protein DctP [unclassified Halomonas]|uniref:TRAP transporter substrate-binding protein DctP n=1 Tax=unclassified Halomonas TaxID=2609666 RepID=UPI0021E3E709|nr:MULTISPECIES: TRAP transporter substrate-binding protein DctP [unclassified Halomonas]UYF99286.1 TRAP transporter substrate-binding protein DctP [Halomonas sp. GD1P12]WNL39558.1 TRAP transporter substrate-binding protein DctP [Halomonas sp. PAMB 3232]WNL42915.1 TRAP transporter substrate-binding protein DctP [Halomonas sp. PAMB 3264]
MKKAPLTLAIMTALASVPAFAVDQINAVHAFPPSLIYTQSFLEFVDKVNERGEGVVQINVRGGPEVIGLSEQPEAVRNGVVDMAYTAASFYAGTVPERDAMVASNTNAIYARENGGIDLLNEIHQEKMGTYYLGWFDSGVSYNLYTIDEPGLDENGDLDISGLRLRSNPVYDAFFQDYLGAQPISLPTTDVYSALERSVVNATGWTQIGLKDLNWDKFLNYRIDPAFFSTDMGVIVNLNKWNQLSPESQQILQEVAIEHERDSAEQLAERAVEQQAELEEDGMNVVTLEGEAAQRYADAAREATWARMKGQMERHPMGLEHYDELIEKFNDL